MGSREGHRDRGLDRARGLMESLARDWRDARLAAGVSQRAVARAAGLSRETYARIERRQAREIGIGRASVITSVLGGEFSAKIFDGSAPIRDIAHIRLLERLDRRIPARWQVHHEAPMRQAGDRRAWDRRLDGPISIGVEGETRLRDLQALERRMNLKQRDSGVQRLVLLVADTVANRRLIRAYAPQLRASFPLTTREVLTALAEGRDPGANGIVVL
jgi:transcriptional regulator with XRE-family HTH domain